MKFIHFIELLRISGEYSLLDEGDRYYTNHGKKLYNDADAILSNYDNVHILDMYRSIIHNKEDRNEKIKIVLDMCID